MKSLVIFFILFFQAVYSIACSCGPPDYNFYNNIHKEQHFIFGIVQGYSDTVTIHNMRTQVWYVTVLDTIGNPNTEIGNTAVVTGQDGLNCGESYVRYSLNDTIVLALYNGFYYTYGRDSFYLDGCGTHYLTFGPGAPEHLTIQKLKEKIKGIITGVVSTENDDKINIYPNPFQQYIFINDVRNRFGKCQLFNIFGREVIRFEGFLHHFSELLFEDLPSGMYVLNIATDNKNYTFTIPKI
jgi:hypothetical protein